MSTIVTHISRLILVICIALHATHSWATDVPFLKGKPSSDEILQALSPTPSKTGPRMRGLSLGTEAASQPVATTKPAENSPRALDLDIQFAFNSAALLQDGKDVLDQLAEALKSDTLSNTNKIVLEGHTDAKGSVAYNKILSLKRAQSAKNYLIQKGIAAAKLKVIGKGSSELADPQHPEGETNRRVRIVLP